MNYWALVVGILMLLYQADKKETSFTIDFGKEGRVNDWYVVTDRVMGGVSTSKVAYSKESLVFSGYVSLENNGGFASIRSEQQLFNLSGFSDELMRISGSETIEAETSHADASPLRRPWGRDYRH